MSWFSLYIKLWLKGFRLLFGLMRTMLWLLFFLSIFHMVWASYYFPKSVFSDETFSKVSSQTTRSEILIQFGQPSMECDNPRNLCYWSVINEPGAADSRVIEFFIDDRDCVSGYDFTNHRSITFEASDS